ncbi:putative fluoride ion transporter CrcB [bacterium MnTg02]|nr:putative fluoride ion transporter CrcB [bacterium MnTg02]
MVKALLAVGAGGAFGAIARYLVSVSAVHLLGLNFPYGTLAVNVLGSLVMGVLIETMALAWTVSTEARLFMVVGFLGAFTTFSTFSLDFAVLYERGRLDLCALYLSLSVLLSIGALFLGLFIVRGLLAPNL